ncbi:hypothetical protein BBJ28_00013128 [Nothophytophthora sp. Chile5]|nr:hypothetical protein BBJ28_00013128 [Nothophytophthora sp. Chile5]
MPKGPVLTAKEREQITELHRAGASGREIARQLERSKTVVLNFLRAPTQYATTKRSGRKRALSGADEAKLHAALFRRPADASRPVKKSAEQIKREFDVPLSVRRIQQLLCEWRTQARRQQDGQQAETTSQRTSASQGDEALAGLPPTAEEPAESETAGLEALGATEEAAAAAAVLNTTVLGPLPCEEDTGGDGEQATTMAEEQEGLEAPLELPDMVATSSSDVAIL